MSQDFGIKPADQAGPLPSDDRFANLDPIRNAARDAKPPETGQGPVMREYLVVATENRTGQPYPPFLIPAVDESAARRACRRNWLTIQTVTLFDERTVAEKPRLLQWGPPLSDKSFEHDYHNRPPDPDSAGHMSGRDVAVGGFLIFRLVLAILRIFGG